MAKNHPVHYLTPTADELQVFVIDGENYADVEED